MYLDLEDSRARIAQDTVLIGGLQDKVVELEALVQKQKVTISNQSKTISDPRLIRKQQQQQQHPSCGNGTVVPMTPQRHAQGQGQCQGLSPFESPYSARSGFSGASGASGVGVEYLPPPPMFDVNGNGVVPKFPGQCQDQLLPGVNPLPIPSIWDPLAWSNGSPYAVAYLDPTACIAEFSSRLRELWAKTELFGQVHANIPSVYKDSHLDKRVKEYIMSVSDRQGASSLLGSPATRFFLVAKAINAFLVHDVLKVTIIKGFDEQADMGIGGIKKQLFPGEPLLHVYTYPNCATNMLVDTPTPVRHIMIIAMTTRIQTLKTKPGFIDFCQQKTRDHMHKLWRLIGPLTHPQSNTTIDPITGNSQAWTDLSTIVSEAEMLALDMYSVPFEYQSEFPAVNEAFDPVTMVNSDAFITGDPMMLAESDCRVRLGVTPVVRARDNSDCEVGVVRAVSMGNVLLRMGGHK